MCQHWERGPHAQLISTISLIALWAIFVGSTFVTQTEVKLRRWKEEDRHRRKEGRSRDAIQIQIVQAVFLPLSEARGRWLGEVPSILRKGLYFNPHQTYTQIHTHACAHAHGNWWLLHGQAKELIPLWNSWADLPPMTIPPHEHTYVDTHFLKLPLTVSHLTMAVTQDVYPPCVSVCQQCNTTDNG